MIAPLFFSLTIVGTTLVTLVISTTGMSFNRALYNIPTSILENNVTRGTKDEDGQVFYFLKDNLEKDIEKYFSYIFQNKISSYKIGYKYFKFKNEDYVIDLSTRPDAIQIRVVANYYLDYKIDGYISFKIDRGTIV
ncbi:MAG TPA: hypothetical protein VJY64_01015 [Candidatus Onthovivens sp.]|nr:hypothetical protein [Candidatus Onthovivens sp.]